jgi:5-methylcytosine-specific restriction endonuclease McrA
MKCRVLATTEIKNCKVCGKTFSTWISRKKSDRGKYCSSACYWKSLGIDPQLLAEHKKDSCRKYRREHPEWCAEVKHRRRARESNGHFTATQWKDIKIAQNFTCLLCGKSEPKIKLTVDHIIPLSKGGDNNVGNIQGLCGSCNSRKSFN